MVKKVETHKITESGLEALKTELKYLQEEKKPHLIEIIEDMRNKGDLSENDGYTLALEDYESNEIDIAKLQHMIETAVVIEEAKKSSKVIVGSNVKVKSNGKDITYTIVGHSEANPLENKISDKTPIGAALLGKSTGDKVKVQLPVGSVEFEILEVA